MVLTLIWRVGFGLGLDELVDRIAARVVSARAPTRPRWRLLAARLQPGITVAASVLVVMIASVGTLRSAGAAATLLEIVLVGLGATAILAAFVLARRARPASRQAGHQFRL